MIFSGLKIKKKLFPPHQHISRSSRYFYHNKPKSSFLSIILSDYLLGENYWFSFIVSVLSPPIELKFPHLLPHGKSHIEKLGFVGVQMPKEIKQGRQIERDSIRFQKKNSKSCPLISLLKWKTTAIPKHLVRQTGGQCVGWTKKERRKCCKPGYNYSLALSYLQCFTYVWSSFPSLPLPAQACTFIWT